MMLRLKPGVRLHPSYAIATLLVAAADVFRPADLTITSGIDGKHMEGSLHGKGLALDFSTHHLPLGEKDRVVTELRQALGPDYDILLELLGEPNEHLHVEYQPK